MRVQLFQMTVGGIAVKLTRNILVSSTHTTDHHDIAEILLKVALNTFKQTQTYQICDNYVSYKYIYIH